MSEKKVYTPEEIEELSEQAAKNAMEHFKHGLNCAECVLQGYLDLGISSYPPEIIGLVSGMGGGMGQTKHACGAVNGGMIVIGSEKGRKNPYALEAMEDRVKELNDPETGIYARHRKYLREFAAVYGSLDCLDLTMQHDDFNSVDRKRGCKKIIGEAAKLATKAALSQ